MADQRLRIVYSGRVQGVGFRYHVVRQARGLDVTGYVMNCRDGSVEVVAEGPADQVRQLVESILAEAPGHIANHSVRQESPTGEFATFSVRH
jgi:acylphosphatase